MMQKVTLRAVCLGMFFCTLITFSNHSTWAQPRTTAAALPLVKNPLTHLHRFSETAQISTTAFFQSYRSVLNLSSHDELKPISVNNDALGQTHHRMQQFYKNIAVADRHFLVHEKDGKVLLAHGELVSGLDLEVTPSLSEAQALRAALQHIGAETYMWENPANEVFLQREQNDPHATFAPKGELKISAGFEARRAEDFRLVYRFDIYAEKPLGRYDVDVDANTAEIVKVTPRSYEADVPGTGVSVYNGTVPITMDQVSALSYRLREAGRGRGIETYDMQRTTSFSNARDFTDSDNEFDSKYNEAGVSVHWAAEATYDYFRNIHGRRSYNGNDAVIRSYAHFDNGWFNAQWDGSRLRFGDGNGNATPLVSIDIVSHEFSHGVTQFSANLVYQGESGALNESFSDIFGNAVEFFLLGANGSWDIGEGAVRIRSMSNPRTLGDPNTYLGVGWASTVPGSGDNGGVHTNSGVQNYWFYLLSAGGSGVNDNNDSYSITGLGLAQAEKIAYRNLTAYLTPNSGYFDAREATIYSTTDLYGDNSTEYQTAIAAWDAVGVYYPKREAALVAGADTLAFLAESAVGQDTSTLVITNLGLANLTIASLQLNNSDFRLLAPPTLPRTLGYRSTLNLRIIFKPTSPSIVFGTVVLASNDPALPVATVTLRGKGFAIRPAAAGSIYANAGRASSGVLFTLNPNDGSGTNVGTTNFDELNGIALRPSNNVIHGTVANSSFTTIVRVDAQSGEAYPVVTVRVPNMRAIAFDTNDQLYGAEFTRGKLYRVNLANGDTTLVGETKLTLLSGLAINPLDGSLWATRATGQSLYRLDKTTGAATVAGTTGINQIADLEFDVSGNLFGLAGFAPNTVSDFVQINPTNGKATKIGTTGFKSVFSLAIRGAITTRVAEPANNIAAPKIFALAQNHPNPFNPSTQIAFSLPTTTLTTLKVFDLAGREVATLISGKLAAGEHRVHFEANDLAAGVYLYRLQAGDQIAVRKLVLVK